MNGQLEAVEAALGVLRRATTTVADRLAGLTAERGRISTARLDERQLAAYDFAQLATMLAVAEELLAHARGAGDRRLQELLATVFAGEVGQEFSGRLGARPGDFGLTAAELRELLGGEELAAFAATATVSARYEEAARLVGERGDVGEPGLDKDHVLIRDTFRRYVDEKVVPRAEAIHRQDLLLPEEFIRDLSELGCFGLSIPARYGGVADRPDYVGMVVVTEELSRGSLGAAGSLMTRPEILVKALLKGGTEAQRDRWLPKIAAGEQMVAISVTEPDYGSDVAGIRLTARPVEGGYRLSGAKIWCTFGGRAELTMLLARTDPDLSKGHRGLSAFVIEKPAYEGHAFEHVQPDGGRLAGRAIPTLGYRGMHSFELEFEEYFVPAENLIGGEAGLGQGFYLQMQGFEAGRLQTAGRALGVMQAAFEAGLAYSKQRHVFGRPIFDYPLTQYKLARSAALIQGARQFAYYAARLMNEEKGQLEASMAKLFASRAAEWVTREAQQLHGGMGYAEEFPVSRYFVDARILSIFEGTEEILALRVVARALLEERLKAGAKAFRT